MSSEEADEDPDAHDARLMRQLAYARGRTDGDLRAELILTELLARHQPNIRRIVIYRTFSRRPSEPDIDEIVNSVLIRAVKALEGDFDIEMPFGALVAKNIDWAVIDWVRARARHADEIPTDDVQVPDGDPHDRSPSLADEAERLHELIRELPERDGQIVAERMLFGLKPQQIAEIHNMSRGAVDVATLRALKKLEDNEAVQTAHAKLGVREPARRSEKQA